jgi:F0F1-type ATP synthase epsilon subunit
MKLLFITPESTLLETDGIAKVRVPLSDGGSLGIHPGHHPLIAETRAGSVEFGRDGYSEAVDLRAGILQVRADQVTIYTSGFAEQPDLTESRSEHPTRWDQLTEKLQKRLEEDR